MPELTQGARTKFSPRSRRHSWHLAAEIFGSRRDLAKITKSRRPKSYRELAEIPKSRFLDLGEILKSRRPKSCRDLAEIPKSLCNRLIMRIGDMITQDEFA